MFSKPNLLPLHQVFVCGTYVFPQLHKFWNIFRSKLANKNSYTASISEIRLHLQKLQEQDNFA